jgi:hypothetical protein
LVFDLKKSKSIFGEASGAFMSSVNTSVAGTLTNSAFISGTSNFNGSVVVKLLAVAKLHIPQTNMARIARSFIV